MNNMLIRDAVAEDVPFISRCILAAVGSIELTDDWNEVSGASVAIMEELCAMEHSLYCWNHVRVACDEGKPVGCILSYDGRRYARAREMTFEYAEERMGIRLEDSDMETCREEYYLDSMAVIPSYRGRGVGHKLMKDAIRIGKEDGHTRFSLIADTQADSLIEYYEAIGFVKEEEIRFFGHPYYRMIRYEHI